MDAHTKHGSVSNAEVSTCASTPYMPKTHAGFRLVHILISVRGWISLIWSSLAHNSSTHLLFRFSVNEGKSVRLSWLKGRGLNSLFQYSLKEHSYVYIEDVILYVCVYCIIQLVYSFSHLAFVSLYSVLASCCNPLHSLSFFSLPFPLLFILHCLPRCQKISSPLFSLCSAIL